jgi:hypothetical protein
MRGVVGCVSNDSVVYGGASGVGGQRKEGAKSAPPRPRLPVSGSAPHSNPHFPLSVAKQFQNNTRSLFQGNRPNETPSIALVRFQAIPTRAVHTLFDIATKRALHAYLPAPCHSSSIARNWIEKDGIHTLHIPPSSERGRYSRATTRTCLYTECTTFC